MEFIEWESRFSVGVKQIDAEHQKLVGIINELHDAMSRGQGKDVLERIFKDLTEYTQTHFANEEALMQKTGYPDLENHRLQHVDLIRQIDELQAKAKTGSALVSINVLNFLRGWLTDHMLDSDHRYQAHLNSKGIY
jgi:hemerythrin